MSDQRNRELERAAAGGDPSAAMALRVEALRADREIADPAGLAFAVGVPEAVHLFLAFGISTLGGLLTTTREELANRPREVAEAWMPLFGAGWWGNEAIVSPDVVRAVFAGVSASGLRLRRPEERVHLSLPQKVFQLPPGASIGDRDFFGVLPRVVAQAIPPALRGSGIHSWSDLTACSADELTGSRKLRILLTVASGVDLSPRVVNALRFELARRGLSFAPDKPPSPFRPAPSPRQEVVEVSMPFHELDDVDVSDIEEGMDGLTGGIDDLSGDEVEDDGFDEYVVTHDVRSGQAELIDDRTGGSAEVQVEEDEPDPHSTEESVPEDEPSGRDIVSD